MMNRIFQTMLIALLGTAIGCVGSAKKQLAETVAANQGPILTNSEYQAPPAEEGSLWRKDVSRLYTDAKARHVGDTVTIDIVEVTSSKMAANTSSARTSSIDAGVDNALGYMKVLKDSNANLGKDDATGVQANRLFKADMTNSFSGKGSSDRSGSITASIGARVAEVLPNGNLVLFGRREMKVNNDVQYIIVSGAVRPEDIGSDNRVQSTYIADARIEYLGRGAIADKQKAGWVTRLLDNVWPF
jgi:flagellar L-ring protein FlgH